MKNTQLFYVFDVIYLNCTKHCHGSLQIIISTTICAVTNVLQSKPLAIVLKIGEIYVTCKFKNNFGDIFLNIRKFGVFEEMKCGVMYHETH